MLVTVVASQRAPHQIAHQNAMADGLRAIGYEPVIVHSHLQVTTKHVVCWGWRVGEELLKRGHDVLVMERGYIGDRFKYTSLGWNGLNGHAFFPEYPDDEGRRFCAHGGVLKDWGIPLPAYGYALILGQVPTDKSLQGKNLMPWYEDIAQQLMADGWMVKFRPHPEALRKGYRQTIKGVETATGTLADNLSGAALAVCFNSNSSVDAVCAGVACVVGDRGSMAYDMCSDRLKRYALPRRDEWAAQLAHKQWELHEIASGSPLEPLFRMML